MITDNNLNQSRAVRRILVKHNIDLGRLRMRCDNGKVKLSGALTCLYQSSKTVTQQTATEIITEIKKLPETTAVYTADLSGWH